MIKHSSLTLFKKYDIIYIENKERRIVIAKHIVTCPYCKEKFDTQTTEHVKVSNGTRYAHVECALAKEKELKEKAEAKKIKEQFKEQLKAEKTKDEEDKSILEDYIKNLFNITYITPRIRKQINEYIKEYNYTYSGMLKALKYHFEIKQGSIEKANESIGILPYVYKQAYNYYYALWLAQSKNINKDIVSYTPVTKEIHIPIPKKKIRKPKKNFAFLDEIEVE